MVDEEFEHKNFDSPILYTYMKHWIVPLFFNIWQVLRKFNTRRENPAQVIRLINTNIQDQYGALNERFRTARTRTKMKTMWGKVTRQKDAGGIP